MELNSKGPYPRKRNNILLLLVRFFVKLKIKHFHDEVMQNAKKCTKMCDACAQLLFCLLNLLFLTFLLPPRHWILKSLMFLAKKEELGDDI